MKIRYILDILFPFIAPVGFFFLSSENDLYTSGISQYVSADI